MDCRSVIQEITATLRPQAEARGLDFKAALPTAEVLIQTDRRALSQILLNLANNAIKFTDHGSVSITIQQSQANGLKLTEFQVVDTGIGIRPEFQAKLFQAFNRLDAPARSRHEGTGLGLHLSQKLAGLLGGEVTCQSEQGRGITFTLALTEK